MRTKVTKSDIREFLNSFGDDLLQIEDKSIRDAIINIYEQLDKYILFGKPSIYELLDWEYDECFSMPESYSYNVDNIDSIEPLFINWIREKKLNKLI